MKSAEKKYASNKIVHVGTGANCRTLAMALNEHFTHVTAMWTRVPDQQEYQVFATIEREEDHIRITDFVAGFFARKVGRGPKHRTVSP